MLGNIKFVCPKVAGIFVCVLYVKYVKRSDRFEFVVNLYHKIQDLMSAIVLRHNTMYGMIIESSQQNVNNIKFYISQI